MVSMMVRIFYSRSYSFLSQFLEFFFFFFTISSSCFSSPFYFANLVTVYWVFLCLSSYFNLVQNSCFCRSDILVLKSQFSLRRIEWDFCSVEMDLESFLFSFWKWSSWFLSSVIFARLSSSRVLSCWIEVYLYCKHLETSFLMDYFYLFMRAILSLKELFSCLSLEFSSMSFCLNSSYDDFVCLSSDMRSLMC